MCGCLLKKKFPYFYNQNHTHMANATDGLQGMYVVEYIWKDILEKNRHVCGVFSWFRKSHGLIY